MSDYWEPPAELLGPVQSIESNLAILILSSPTVGHEALVLLGRFISEQSLFTLWFLKDVKGSNRELADVLNLTTFGEAQTKVVYDAWKEYERAIKLRLGREKVIAAEEKLVEALRSAVDALVKVRSTA